MDDPNEEGVSGGEAELYHGQTQGGMRIRAFGLNISLPDDRKATNEEVGKMGRQTNSYARWIPVLIAFILAAVFSIGWVFMVVTGALFHEFGILRPVGYWPALGISLGLLVIFSMLGNGVRGGKS